MGLFSFTGKNLRFEVTLTGVRSSQDAHKIFEAFRIQLGVPVTGTVAHRPAVGQISAKFYFEVVLEPGAKEKAARASYQALIRETAKVANVIFSNY